MKASHWLGCCSLRLAGLSGWREVSFFLLDSKVGYTFLSGGRHPVAGGGGGGWGGGRGGAGGYDSSLYRPS